MASTEYEQVGSLSVSNALHTFVENELLPAAGLDSAQFWQGLETLLDDFTATNRELLRIRDLLQQQIDDWHGVHDGPDFDHDEYVAFLRDIDYLRDPGEPFEITTEGVDAEIARIAGPQLVVPVSNARFALNAANARWGSLYDALYGTDMIPEDDGCEKDRSFNPVRGEKVIETACGFLDEIAPLAATRPRRSLAGKADALSLLDTLWYPDVERALFHDDLAAGRSLGSAQ